MQLTSMKSELNSASAGVCMHGQHMQDWQLSAADRSVTQQQLRGQLPKSRGLRVRFAACKRLYRKLKLHGSPRLWFAYHACIVKAPWPLHTVPVPVLCFQQLHVAQHSVDATCKHLHSLPLHDCLAYTTAGAQTAAHRHHLLVRLRDTDAISQELHGKLQRTQAELVEAQHQVLAISLWSVRKTNATCHH